MAREWRYAADLMARHGPSLILRGDTATLQELVGRLPAELVQADPELVLLGAADRILSGDPEAAAANLVAAPQGARPSEQRGGRFALLRATVSTALAWQVGDLDQVLVAGVEALALQSQVATDGEGDDARAITLFTVGGAELWAGHLDSAELHLREGLAVAVQAGLTLLEFSCLNQLALLHALRGEPREALRWGTNAVEMTAEETWSSSMQAAGATRTRRPPRQGSAGSRWRSRSPSCGPGSSAPGVTWPAR
jgi:ATP/maltotriose-dependent transcriptional regulator MalT